MIDNVSLQVASLQIRSDLPFFLPTLLCEKFSQCKCKYYRMFIGQLQLVARPKNSNILRKTRKQIKFTAFFLKTGSHFSSVLNFFSVE